GRFLARRTHAVGGPARRLRGRRSSLTLGTRNFLPAPKCQEISLVGLLAPIWRIAYTTCSLENSTALRTRSFRPNSVLPTPVFRNVNYDQQKDDPHGMQ